MSLLTHETLIRFHRTISKPGKLDLRQFDNITNAIGKLSIQSSHNKPPVEAQSSKLFASQVSNEPPQESGFFKSRARKINKADRAKESPRRGKLRLN